MNDKFFLPGIGRMYKLLTLEKDQILGIPEQLFFKPSDNKPFRLNRYGINLDTPIGVAAGPHSQLSQNLISSWLCGARYLELKTIQTLDELDVSKPCIDMQDEGYNCEWSQELKIHQSFSQYLEAWILIHVLAHKLEMPAPASEGMIFNMSVGYNMEGVLKENVQWFFEKMADARTEKEQMMEEISVFYPEIHKIHIPDRISDSVTLSTMHGCPPAESLQIARYLIEQKKLNTTVKLNPTLLGPEALRDILNTRSGFHTVVPDIAFEHDLKYNDAKIMIRELQESASKNNVSFSLKVSNTLESENNRPVFPEKEKMMYMSGRALHPVSINLAAKLQNDFAGILDISFSAGADCFNVADVIACGLKPVTVCSDILKPGGYGRLAQYIGELDKSFTTSGAQSISDFILKKSGNEKLTLPEAVLHNLNQYAASVIKNPEYKKAKHGNKSIKSGKKLDQFDCIAAPCIGACPSNQDIPEYMFHVSNGNLQEAAKVIMQTNPFPSVCGMVCEHNCQAACTRMNYDEPLLIREIKRYVTENATMITPSTKPDNGVNVAIIGAGPSGLACAYFLRLQGFGVNVFETEEEAGGMVQRVIPSFRLTREALQEDIRRIEALGVNIQFGKPVTKEHFGEMQKNFDYIYVAIGAQKATMPKLPGIEAGGVVDPLEFLTAVKRGERPAMKHVVVIGGGNTAMDVARTAKKVVSEGGSVTVAYRRTKHEMPAAEEEIMMLSHDGIPVVELAIPESIVTDNGIATGLQISRARLEGKDASGRPRPVKIEGSSEFIAADTVIFAIGQTIVSEFVDASELSANPDTFETMLPNVFIGGDAFRGASSVIRAIGDGRKVAQMIGNRASISLGVSENRVEKGKSYTEMMAQRSTRVHRAENSGYFDFSAKDFMLETKTLGQSEAIEEASRCLFCNEVCSICVTVCPNRANRAYFVEPVQVAVHEVSKSHLIPRLTDFVTITQKVQVLNIADFCNACGNCSTFCPTSGRPFVDKPKVHLTLESFRTSESGYYMSILPGKVNLIFKAGGVVHTLAPDGAWFRYDSDDVSIDFTRKDFKPENVRFNNQETFSASTEQAVKMYIIFGALIPLFTGIVPEISGTH
ncbi:MAG: putative selenate reductase subunit YgfK [Bacteroidetes bacterium]|nr:putative selenate reductase subunit YgfK [Bacteroidota bacterium]MBU1718820.1 putative selenate reductase subunit YgfK [Bacteroidota bacterium]